MIIFFTFYAYAAEKAIEISGSYFGMLPLELRSKIIKNVFSFVIGRAVDDNKEDNDVLQMPLLLGVKFSRELCCLQKLCPLEIAGKKFTASELFLLPEKERDIIFRMKNRSIFLDGNIGGHDFTILDASQHRKKLKGLKLEVNFVNSNVEYLDRITIIISMIGTVISRLQSSPNYTALAFFGYSVFLKGCVEILNIFNPNFSMTEKWRRKKVEFKE